MQTMAVSLMRVVGVLLFVLGLMHNLATSHIPGLLEGCAPSVQERAIGPFLLDHVLVGFLLLPLGYTTWLAAGAIARDEPWARRVLVANTLVFFTLPVSLGVLMHRPEYYTAPLFLTGVGLVTVIALLMAAATVVLVRTE